MAKQVSNNALIKKLAAIEAWAAGLQLECQQTRKLLEAEDVSTSTKKQRMSKIAIEARVRLRRQLFKQ